MMIVRKYYMHDWEYLPIRQYKLKNFTYYLDELRVRDIK